MANVQLFFNDTVELLGEGGVDGENFKVDKLRLKKGGVEAVFVLNPSPERQLTIPLALLNKTGETYTFRPLADINDELAVLRERLRAHLNQGFVLKFGGGETFLDAKDLFGTAFATGSVRLRLPWLDGEVDVWMSARADARIKVVAGGSTFYATTRLGVDVRANDILGSIDWVAPDWPAFNLPFPMFSVPSLSWHDLSQKLLDIAPAFQLPRVPFVDQLTFKWEHDQAPKLVLKVESGSLKFQTDSARNGSVLYSQAPILEINAFWVKADASGIIVEGTTKATIANLDIPEQNIEDPLLPFDVKIADKDANPKGQLSVTVAGAKCTFTMTKLRVQIRAKKDPTLFLVFQVDLDIVVDGDKITTTVNKLEVVEPYPIEFVVTTAKDLIGKLMRIRLPLKSTKPDAPGLGAFLERVADMLKAAAVWLAERANDAAKALAGIAEAGFELLKQAAQAILKAAQAAGDYVEIEVRLDPKTYRVQQILFCPREFPSSDFMTDVLGFRIKSDAKFKPCVVVDLREPNWVGLAFVNIEKEKPSLHVDTDLWLSRATSPAQPLKPLSNDTGAKDGALLKFTATLKGDRALVPFAFRSGRIEFLQKTEYKNEAQFGPVTVGESGTLEPLSETDVELKLDAAALTKRIVNLLSRPKPAASGKFSEFLETYIQISAGTPTLDLKQRTVVLPLALTIFFNADKKFSAEAKADLTVDLNSLSAALHTKDRIGINRREHFHEELLGLGLDIDKNPNPPQGCPLDEQHPEQYEAFYLDLQGGKEEFGLSKCASAVLTLPGMASSGKSLQFQVNDFRLGRDGLNLSAATVDDPVMLGGLNMPFRFRAGRLDIVNSKLSGATISGSGQLPPALMGEANVSINLRLAENNGAVIVESAEAKLDKGDDPIVCESTRFRFSLSKVEMSFERANAARDGDYHFYFLLTGSARFQPKEGEFAGGLLKNLKELEFVLDRAPLTGDGRLLFERISFQAKVDPPKRSRFFDLFEFELRGIGLYPSAPAFDGSPAISISGQVKFTNFADKVQPHFRFHEMWVAPPAKGSFLPRVRFDGLTVGLDLGGMAEVEGTAIAVDEKLPSIYKPSTLPANVTANGFLASGRLSIKGWASMSASMGFLELRRPGESPRSAFFFYIQQNRLSIPIPTPVGEIYLREVGFGFGYRYTLAGIAEAETAETPRELVRILDEVSKYQGSLDSIVAWAPTYDSATLTLAMRAMFAVSSASRMTEYNAAKEKELPNPLLFDVIAAIRSDLTFLMMVRAWLCVNYADWDNQDFAGRTKPTLRGYLYISVPKKTFLGRFVSTSEGFIGEHPRLPEPLLFALKQIKFSYSSTLYITPGLFHFELGWPYELGVEIGNPNGNFYLYCKGGMINRIEDGAVLYGYALKAGGFAQIGVNTGGSFGAAVFARADFSIEGKLISYLSVRAPGETMFYGCFRFDVHVSFSVRVWFEFSIFGGTIHLEIGFSLGLTVAVAVEMALLLNNGLGIRVYASVGIQAFGRSLCLGVELQLGSGVLDQARARVDRFLSLGLGTPIPETSSVGRPPQVEASRETRANAGDERIKQSAEAIPSPKPAAPEKLPPIPTTEPNIGQDIAPADFWAMLFPVVRAGAGEWYVLQLIPRDLTGAKERKGSFYSPISHKVSSFNKLQAFVWTDDKKIHLDPSPVASDPRPISNRELPLEVGNKPTVGQMWRENFVVWEEQAGKPKFKDPVDTIRKIERTALPSDSDAAARALEMAGRQRAALSADENKHRAIEERRSAMIGIVANSALELAQFGEPKADTWYAPNLKNLTCVDLGLTFLIEKGDLSIVFDFDGRNPPKAKELKVQRAKKEGQWTTDGDVYLFNPPDRMFANSQPRLDRLTSEQRADGIALNWDLEPAWGRSGDDLWDDPEFHLRHYRIERYIDKLDDVWKHEFDVKAAAPVNGESFFRPPLQFLDDLTLPKGFPKELRDVITGKYANPVDRPEQYKNEFIVRYKIFAIDCAGTSDFGTLCEVKILPGEEVQKGPVSASLQVAFKGDNALDPAVLPSSLKAKVDYRFDPLPGESSLPTEPVVEIAVLRSKPIPSGQYGADALSGALQDVSDVVIDAATDMFSPRFVTEPEHTVACDLSDKNGRTIEGYLEFASGAIEKKFTELFNTKGETLRVFLRQKSCKEHDGGKASPWQRCPIELRMGPEKKQPPVDAAVEEYERPINLKYHPIQRYNFTEAAAGRVYFLEPTESARIKEDGTLELESFVTVLDRKRRAGVRLRWKARPSGLTGEALPSDAWRLVGGFHLFDVTHFDVRDTGPDHKEVPKPIAVALLPQTARGLEPSELGDLSLIEAAYPSNEGRRRFSSWFSAAESAPFFPDPNVFRRSLMPSVDEGVVSALFEKGKPVFLDVSVEVEFPKGAPFEQNVGWHLKANEEFAPSRVREFLQSALLKQAVADRTKLTITAKNKAREELVSIEFVYETCPTLHPLIADTLDLVRYSQSKDHPEQVFRRYEVVLDPWTHPSTDQLESWMDSAPEQRDPYGWGILRTLGLATGFRLYDTSTGRFLAGTDLHKHVGTVFHAAKARYAGWDLGAPFIDLLTAPMETARAFSFDGGGEATGQDAGQVGEKQISIIQIALRPRINNLVAATPNVPSTAPNRTIRYYMATVQAIEEKTYVIKLSDARYDLDLVATSTDALGTIRVSLLKRSEIERLSTSMKLRAPVTIYARLVGRDNLSPGDDISSIVSVDPKLKFEPVAKFGTLEELGSTFEALGGMLGTFDALDNPSWAMQFFGTDLSSSGGIHDAFVRLMRWAAPVKLEWKPKETKPGEPRRTELSTFAGKVVIWWRRFLDHGVGVPTGVVEQSPPIRISLGTIGRPGTWRMPEDADGTVGVFLLDDSEYGAVKRFIVRPYSRYQAFSQALDAPAQPLEAPDKDCLIDITLPRTAPVAKPVILSATRVAAEDTRPEVLELIVARTPDEIISSANRTTAMGLASHGISVGFWREFSEINWGTALLKDAFHPGAELGSLTRAVAPVDLTLTDDAWGVVKKEKPTGVVSRATDAWLGAWVYRMQSLPYFYRIHALVHSNAGVVVSEPSGTTFVSGISHLPVPREATYRVTPTDAFHIQFTFQIALLAFEDCMQAEPQWKGSDDYQKLAGLPDPGISYRILLESVTEAKHNGGVIKETLSADSQFDISPSLKSEDQHYLVQGVGERIKLANEGLTWLKAVPIAGTDFWSLPVIGVGTASFLQDFVATVPPCLKTQVIKASDFAVWKQVAPVGSAKLTSKKPSDDAKAAFVEYCQKQLNELKKYLGEEQHDLVTALEKIIADPEGYEFTIANWWLGLPMPSFEGLLSVELSNKFVWNPAAEGTLEQCKVAKEFMLESDCSEGSAADLESKLREHFFKAHAAVITREVKNTVFTSAQISKDRPFDIIQVLDVEKRDTYTDDDLQKLIVYLEEAVASTGAIQSLSGKAAQVPWPASAEAHRSLLEKLFKVTPKLYYIAAVRTPVSDDLAGLTGEFGQEAMRLAEDAWFGPKRKPRLNAIRATAVPTSKEIRHQ